MDGTSRGRERQVRSGGQAPASCGLAERRDRPEHRPGLAATLVACALALAAPADPAWPASRAAADEVKSRIADGALRSPGGRLAPWPFRLDCTAGAPRCPSFVPAGDAADSVPGYGPSPFRGFADPSIREDPSSHRLWMAYSWPHVQVVEPTEPGEAFRLFAVVDIHLAHSDDSGASWALDTTLWGSAAETDPGGSGETGFSSYEVVSLAPRATGDGEVWYGARARYFVPDSGAFLDRRGDSFQLEISEASSPPGLATAPAARLGGAITAPGWQVDANLAALAPEVGDCAIWNEPALHFEGGTLYLATVCMAFDLRTGERLPLREQVALFATEPEGTVDQWVWRYLGALAGPAEADELGGETLTQVDLARARDGALLVLLSPNDWDPELEADIHHGCRVLEVERLDPPTLARDGAGSLVVRATITASDLDVYGPAATGYDPASETGIVFVRRRFDAAAEEMVWSLHRTGLHP